MRLNHLPGCPQLTYCTNIHAGESWDEIRASLDVHVPQIKAKVAPDEPFGLGLRLSGMAAAELVRPQSRAEFKDQLSALGAYVFTLNAFPFGPFHGTRVKEQVYEPDWRSHERVSFTADAANILADVLPENGFGSISTVPVCFKPIGRDPDAISRIVDNLLQATAHLVMLERSTGRRIALALEPEPCCFLETVDETLAFFEDLLLTSAALGRFAQLTQLAPGESELMLRRHLGICYDVCHGAVEYEQPVDAIKVLRGAGIAIPKIQLSSAMRIPKISPPLIPRVRDFDTGIYLHQVVARNGGLRRFADLPEAFTAFREGQADGEWRIHCHVPLFFQGDGDLGSTQDALLRTLDTLKTESLSPHLEIETYTWDILPLSLRSSSKPDDIARELGFVLAQLGE